MRVRAENLLRGVKFGTVGLKGEKDPCKAKGCPKHKGNKNRKAWKQKPKAVIQESL